jgi:hypothetical protein
LRRVEKPMIIVRAMQKLPLLVVAALAACGGNTDDGSKAKLAAELVGCKNENLSLREQLAEAKAALERAKEAQMVKLDPVDIKASPPSEKHMEGNVPPEAVAKVVKQNSGGLRACYEHALKRKPDLQYVASVTARFSVKNTGNATSVSFSPHTDSEMEKCMATTMEKWKFPSFQGDPVAFEQPVNLIAK